MATDTASRSILRRLGSRLLPAFAAVLLVAACTVQDRYRMVRDGNVRECDRTLSEAERERCLESLPPASYDEYERLRRTVPRTGSAAKSAGKSQQRSSPSREGRSD